MGEAADRWGLCGGDSLYREKDAGLEPGRKFLFVKCIMWEASVQSQWINQHSYHRKEFRRKGSGNIR